MSLCARAVALWLAACALAARAQAEGERLQCTHPNCHWKRNAGFSEFYSVNGKTVEIIASAEARFEVKCASVALDDPAWPSFPYLERFQHVSFTGCASSKPYAAALQAFKVDVGFTLELLNIPANENISASSFTGLPSTVQSLTLDAVAVLDLEPGALANLDSIHTLNLHQVCVDRLPPHLDHLDSKLTGIKELPPKALNVSSLWINEKLLNSINGTAPHLKKLEILHAPALETLVLHETTCELLKNGLLKRCRALKVLDLQRACASHLPPGLLTGAEDLTHFTFTHGLITALPQDLFNGTLRLQFIDVSHNKLSSLSSEVFSRLLELRVLQLADNQLSAPDLHALQPLKALTVLDLSRNPLGDLCPAGNASQLPELPRLQDLVLSGVGAPHICAAWLRELHALQHLNFSNNAVISVSCADFRNVQGSRIVVDLTNNPFEQFNCSGGNGGESDMVAMSQIKLLTSTGVNCNCTNCHFVQTLQCFTKMPNETYGYNLPTERLLQLPADPLDATEVLADLQPSLEKLTLHADEGLMLEPGVLSTLPALNWLKQLVLMEVHADHLPPHLDVLKLENTLAQYLPPEAYNVTTLEIREKHLKEIKGSVPRLRNLILHDVSSLVTLVLNDTLPELLQDGLIHQVEPLTTPWITTVEFNRAKATALPPNLLVDVPDLRIFRYKHGLITTLPSSLFQKNRLLEVVDLSENSLESLQSELFATKLQKLQTLHLEGNRLRAQDVSAVAPLVALTTLDLSRNPLGDLCPNGTISALSSLRRLQHLLLNSTHTPRVCSDWFEKRDLRHLDLRNNDVRSLTCKDLKHHGKLRRGNGTVVDVTGNLIEEFDCSWEGDDDVSPKLKVHSDSWDQCHCNCPSVWQCVS